MSPGSGTVVGHPKPAGRWPSLGQKCPGLRPPCSLPSSSGAGDAAELPFSGATPGRGTCLKGLWRSWRCPPSLTIPYCRCAHHTALPRWAPHRPAWRPGLSSNLSRPATPCASGTPWRWESCPKAVPSCERASSFPACSPKTSPTFLLN